MERYGGRPMTYQYVNGFDHFCCNRYNGLCLDLLILDLSQSSLDSKNDWKHYFDQAFRYNFAFHAQKSRCGSFMVSRPILQVLALRQALG
eukprot:scaffold662_cov364-Pavlova_lutheri.AAC.67